MRDVFKKFRHNALGQKRTQKNNHSPYDKLGIIVRRFDLKQELDTEGDRKKLKLLNKMQKRKAIKDARRYPLARVENEAFLAYKQFLDETHAKNNIVIQETEGIKAKLVTERERKPREHLAREYQEAIKPQIQDILAKEDVKLANLALVNVEYNNAVNDVEELTNLEHDIIHNRLNGERPAHKSWLNNDIFYRAAVGAYILGDCAYNYNAITELGEIHNLAAIPICALVGGAVGVGAHYLGKALRSFDKTELLSAGILSSLAVGSVIFLRTAAGDSVQLTLLNGVFYCVGVSLAFARYRCQEFWEVRDARIEAQKREAQKKSEADKVMREVEAVTKKEQSKLAHQPANKADEDLAMLDRAIAGCDNVISQVAHYDEDIAAQIENGKAETLNACRKEAARLSETKGRGSFWSKLGNFNPLSRNGHHKQTTLFALVMVLCMTACEQAQYTQSITYFDQTCYEHSQRPVARDVLAFYSDMENGNVKIVPISDRFIQDYASVTRKPSTPYLLRKGNEDPALSDFKNDFTIKFDRTRNLDETYQYSFVFPTVMEHLKPLSQSGHERRTALIFSDLTHHMPRGFSFYQYRQNPEQIISTDYEVIVQKLEASYPASRDINLDGVEISVVFLPNQQDDQLFRYIRQWWSKYLTGKGATIRFVPRLELLLEEHSHRLAQVL